MLIFRLRHVSLNLAEAAPPIVALREEVRDKVAVKRG